MIIDIFGELGHQFAMKIDKTKMQAAYALAIAKAHGTSALAKKVATTRQRLHQALVCPADLTIKIEKATGISRHRLRPDLYPEE